MTIRTATVVLSMALLASAAQARDTAETACDRLAGFDHSPRVAGLPGVYAVTDPQAAIEACETALAEHPQTPFFAVLLARALLVADPDDPRAPGLIRRAQDAHPALVHGRIGWLLEVGQGGVAADPVQARATYIAGCALNPDPLAWVSCNNLAMMLIDGRGGPADPFEGAALLQALCDNGLAMACVNLGYQIGEGLLLPPDPAAAADLFDRACRAGDLMGCNNLGYAFETGEGVAADTGRATALYGRACDGGEMLGCSNLGEAYRRGTGVDADAAMAESLFQRACDADEVYACYALASMLAGGEGLAPDPARARALFGRACDLGDDEACVAADGLE